MRTAEVMDPVKESGRVAAKPARCTAVMCLALMFFMGTHLLFRGSDTLAAATEVCRIDSPQPRPPVRVVTYFFSFSARLIVKKRSV